MSFHLWTLTLIPLCLSLSPSRLLSTTGFCCLGLACSSHCFVLSVCLCMCCCRWLSLFTRQGGVCLALAFGAWNVRSSSSFLLHQFFTLTLSPPPLPSADPLRFLSFFRPPVSFLDAFAPCPMLSCALVVCSPVKYKRSRCLVAPEGGKRSECCWRMQRRCVHTCKRTISNNLLC